MPNVARLALLVGVAAIAFAAIFFRLAAPTPALIAAGWRLVLSSLLLAPIWVPAVRTGRVPLGAALRAGGWYGLHFGAWVASLSRISVAASVSLVTATPLLLAAWAGWTGRDRPGRRLVGSLLLGGVGVALIGGGDLRGGAAAGNALALLGCVAMAAYWLEARAQGDRLPVLAWAGVATGVGGCLLLGLAAALGVPLVPPSLEAAGWIAASALLPQLVGHTLLTWSLRHAQPTEVGMATVAEPIGSTLLAWWLLDERPPWLVLLGCSITSVAVVRALARRAGPADGPQAGW